MRHLWSYYVHTLFKELRWRSRWLQQWHRVSSSRWVSAGPISHYLQDHFVDCSQHADSHDQWHDNSKNLFLQTRMKSDNSRARPPININRCLIWLIRLICIIRIICLIRLIHLICLICLLCLIFNCCVFTHRKHTPALAHAHTVLKVSCFVFWCGTFRYVTLCDSQMGMQPFMVSHIFSIMTLI